MKKAGAGVQRLVANLAGDDEQARINLRANQVRDRYRRVMEAVYRDQARLFLAHTNNVYIMTKGGVRTLIAYVDESIYAAELNAQRELIKLRLLELFGEDVEQFEIHVSRGRYKSNHPFLADAPEGPGTAGAKPAAIPLTQDESAYVDETVSAVEDPRLREALRKAMTADMEWKKGENRVGC